MDDLITEFIAETREMLEALERGLVAWERDPGDRERFDEIFRFVHTVKGNCGFFNLPRLEILAHAAEDALGEVRSGKRKIGKQLVDAVLAIIDRIGRIVEQLAKGADISAGDDSALIAMLAQAADEPEAELQSAPEAKQARSRSERHAEAQRSVRLPTGLVDQVMSGVSDIILVRNELERQLRASDCDPAVITSFSRLSSLLSEVQSAMARVRMQPIGTLLESFQRKVRDLAAELGKQVVVEIESGQVELDREMIERLRDPLLHVVRNAIDHGIEPADERRAAGKRPEGRLLLSARQTGNEIRIAILDDGRGIDADRVVQRAIECGIVTAEQASRMDHGQRLMLICEPGLSTANAVTSLSGRGVGMDVVRANIERIGGKLQIVSEPGDGTRFMFDVPLTLSIVPSITVEVGDQVFAIPRSYVREIVQNSHEIEADPIGGMRHVRVRGDLYPCLGLARLFGIEGEYDPACQTLVMITMIDGSVFALCVDDIADHCDLVIRPVAPQVIDTGLYVGVAQLNNGKPALMLDMNGIAQRGGIDLDRQGRASALVQAQSEEAQVELTQMIVFTGLDGIRRATPMERVERLVELPIAEIAQARGEAHVVIEEAILRLHGYDGTATESGTIDVLVMTDRETRLAYATAGAIDTTDIDLTSATNEAGTAFVLFEGRPIAIVDPAELAAAPQFAAPSCRLPADDRWGLEVLRPLVESAGYRIVTDPEVAVDIEMRIEGNESVRAAASAAPAKRRKTRPAAGEGHAEATGGAARQRRVQ